MGPLVPSTSVQLSPVATFPRPLASSLSLCTLKSSEEDHPARERQPELLRDVRLGAHICWVKGPTRKTIISDGL